MSAMDKIRAEHNVKISGVMLMYIANVLRDRQLSILRALAEAVEGGDFKEIDEIGNSAMANEVVGVAVMKLIEGILGEDDFDKFIDGTLELDKPDFMPMSSTIN